MTELYDPVEWLKSLNLKAIPSRSRKPFVVQCAAFYALQSGVRQADVSVAFGMAANTVSKLANCLNRDPRRRVQYYQDVAREWERIGEADEFGRIYMTQEYADRLRRLKLGVTQPGDDKRRLGPDPSADKFSWQNIGIATIEDTGYDETSRYAKIGWDTRDGVAGWYFIECDRGGFGREHPKPAELWGTEALALDPFSDDAVRGPFRTSAQAYDAAFKLAGRDSPRPKPGRPRKTF